MKKGRSYRWNGEPLRYNVQEESALQDASSVESGISLQVTEGFSNRKNESLWFKIVRRGCHLHDRTSRCWHGFQAEMGADECDIRCVYVFHNPHED